MSRHPSNPAFVSTIIDVRDDLFPEIISGNSQLKRVGGAVVRVWRGIHPAVGRRPVAFLAIARAVRALNALLPPLVPAAPRQPWTYFTFNPWLKNLPAFLTSGDTLEHKVDFRPA